MKTMIQKSKESALFFFAHQDDESGVFQKILDELSIGRNVSCVFFTTGVSKGHDASIRNSESQSVLTKLGVSKEDIYFVGDEVGISDGDLINNIQSAFTWLEQFLLENPAIVSMYIPSWEGGHPDHDILHAISVVVSQKYNLLDVTRQYSLYNGYRCIGPLFRTFAPLKANGSVESTKVSWRNRFRFLALCLQYPSQFKTWIGLFPMMFLHYVFFGTQNLQKVSTQRILERPHASLLYYERRNFSSYEKVSKKINELLRAL
jgi:LmbE family N-acetylglucosaminyl deacetylase